MQENLVPSKHTDSSWVARAVRASSRMGGGTLRILEDGGDMDGGTLRILEGELPVLNFGFSFTCVSTLMTCVLFSNVLRQ